MASTHPNTQGLACHVVDDQIKRIAAGTRCQTGGCLPGKGALMSVPGRGYKTLRLPQSRYSTTMGNPLSSVGPDRARELVRGSRVATGPSGARRRLRRGGYRTRAEAYRALTGLRPPHPADPHRALLTTGQSLQHWLATRLRPRAATLRSYHQHIHQASSPTSAEFCCVSCAWMMCRAPSRSWPAPRPATGGPAA